MEGARIGNRASLLEKRQEEYDENKNRLYSCLHPYLCRVTGWGV